ncbi:hypothetical protein P7K49_037898, partial [Saguinus oedipus]
CPTRGPLGVRREPPLIRFQNSLDLSSLLPSSGPCRPAVPAEETPKSKKRGAYRK